MRMLPVRAALFLLLLIAASGVAYAQGAQYECSTYCNVSMSCSEPCTVCTGPDNIDMYCAHFDWSTCGQEGMTCGGCGPISTWEEDQEVFRQPEPPFFCGGSQSWWHWTNWSVFMLWTKTMRHVTYGQQVCNGVSRTFVMSSYTFYDECYEFIYPDCAAWNMPPSGIVFPSYMECNF